MRRALLVSIVFAMLPTHGTLVSTRQSFPSLDVSLRQNPSPPSSSPAYARLKMVRIVDETTFSEPTEVMSLLIPADWKFVGETKWFLENRSCPEMENISAVIFHVISPDGLSSLERFPNSFWTWVTGPAAENPNRKNPCPLHEPMSPGAYVSDQLLPKVRPGARILSIQPEDEMTRAVMEAVKRSNATALYLGQNVTAKAECARVTYEYPTDGQIIRESIIGTVITFISRRPVSMSHGKGNSVPYSDFYTIHASDFNASRAPETQLQSSGVIFARIMMSLRTNPRWIAGRRLIASRLAHDAENAGGALRHNTLPDMTDQQILDAYRKQSEARLPTAREYDPSVLPLESFVDPQTNKAVELNGGFAFAWSNHEDEYILSNEPSFNPGGGWTQLLHKNQDSERVRHDNSLQATMEFIQDKLNSIGPVNYVTHAHDPRNGPDWTNKFKDEVSRLVANPSVCRVYYHWFASVEDKITMDKDVGFALSEVQKIKVLTRAQVFNADNAATGRVSWTVKVEPPVYVLVVERPAHVENHFVFLDQDLANQVATALNHAAELCGGKLNQ